MALFHRYVMLSPWNHPAPDSHCVHLCLLLLIVAPLGTRAHRLSYSLQNWTTDNLYRRRRGQWNPSPHSKSIKSSWAAHLTFFNGSRNHCNYDRTYVDRPTYNTSSNLQRSIFHRRSKKVPSSFKCTVSNYVYYLVGLNRRQRYHEEIDFSAKWASVYQERWTTTPNSPV